MIFFNTDCTTFRITLNLTEIQWDLNLRHFVFVKVHTLTCSLYFHCISLFYCTNWGTSIICWRVHPIQWNTVKIQWTWQCADLYENEMPQVWILLYFTVFYWNKCYSKCSAICTTKKILKYYVNCKHVSYYIRYLYRRVCYDTINPGWSHFATLTDQHRSAISWKIRQDQNKNLRWFGKTYIFNWLKKRKMCLYHRQIMEYIELRHF